MQGNVCIKRYKKVQKMHPKPAEKGAKSAQNRLKKVLKWAEKGFWIFSKRVLLTTTYAKSVCETVRAAFLKTSSLNRLACQPAGGRGTRRRFPTPRGEGVAPAAVCVFMEIRTRRVIPQTSRCRQKGARQVKACRAPF